jgi:3'-5' exonuclease
VTRIFLDIETLPAKEDQWKEVEPRIREPRKRKRPKGNARLPGPEEAYRNTSLSGEFGRILCIGMIIEDDASEEPLVLGWDEQAGRFNEDEPAILRLFWERLREFDVRRDLLIGHNLFDFDLRFIDQRSVVHGVRPSVELDFRRYRNQPIFDTMQEWSKWGWQDRISLDRLALVLGLPTSKSDELSGSKIYQRYREGKFRLIRDYCMADVVLTRQVYRRLTFADGP